MKNREVQDGLNEPIEDDVNPSTDLISANTVMMVACYGDGVDSAAATINGWTTGPDGEVLIKRRFLLNKPPPSR